MPQAPTQTLAAKQVAHLVQQVTTVTDLLNIQSHVQQDSIVKKELQNLCSALSELMEVLLDLHKKQTVPYALQEVSAQSLVQPLQQESVMPVLSVMKVHKFQDRLMEPPVRFVQPAAIVRQDLPQFRFAMEDSTTLTQEKRLFSIAPSVLEVCTARAKLQSLQLRLALRDTIVRSARQFLISILQLQDTMQPTQQQ